MVPSQTAVLQYYFLSHIDLTQNFISIPYGHNRKGLLQGLVLFEKYVHIIKKCPKIIHNKNQFDLGFQIRCYCKGEKNSLSSSSDSKIIVKETFKEAGMENLYLQLYMNILLMVLATARDKIRLAKSVGRRSNCCWDSSGSFNREGHKQMSHVPCGF